MSRASGSGVQDAYVAQVHVEVQARYDECVPFVQSEVSQQKGERKLTLKRSACQATKIEKLYRESTEQINVTQREGLCVYIHVSL